MIKILVPKISSIESPIKTKIKPTYSTKETISTKLVDAQESNS